MQPYLKTIGCQPGEKSKPGVELRKFLQTTIEHLRDIEKLVDPSDEWDSLLIFRTTENLDNESKKQWQIPHGGTELLKWQDLVMFLDSRSRAR